MSDVAINNYFWDCTLIIILTNNGDLQHYKHKKIKLWIRVRIRVAKVQETSKQKIEDLYPTRKEFLREILYNNIAIIAIQHSKIYFVDTFRDFSHTVEWNSLKSVWKIALYILA